MLLFQHMQVSWFPFFLFDTDWMGREVYHGDPNGDPSESLAYQNGVREGAFGLLLNSVRAREQLVCHFLNFTYKICLGLASMFPMHNQYAYT